jgi:prepilin-type N-terminal cleavage/methylation domain-containing protein
MVDLNAMKTWLQTARNAAPPLPGCAGMTLVEVVVALAITTILIGGVVSGYNYCTNASIKAELIQAANAKAMERLEETRSAVWAPNRDVPVDQLISTNFPILSVSLDVPGAVSNGTLATIQTTITSLSATPPTRSIHVDAVWQYLDSEWVTNSVETIRAADQ